MTPTTLEQALEIALAHQQAGRHDEAIAAYRRALALQDDVAEVHNNLGNTLWRRGRVDDAIAAFRRAIQLKPGAPQPFNNLGAVLSGAGRLDEALIALRRALELLPDYPSAHNNLGNTLWHAGRLDEASSALERALALKPDFADAHNNLGNVRKDQGRLDEALASFRRARELEPDDARAASNLLFNLHAHPDQDAQSLLAEHRQWALRYAAPLATQVQPHPNDRTPDRRLRIGYVSPDLRAHPVGQLLRSLLAHHDHQRFEIIAYADVRTPDDLTRELKSLTDEWNDTVGLGDAELAGRIRSDRIDILVDLALHTAGNRMLVFARKPAPVQVTMFGLPATTGLDTIDYRLTDPYLDPPGATDADYSEQSIRLPHSFWIFQPPDDAPPVGTLPAEKNGFVTFGCLNQFAKVSRPALGLWLKILQTLPDARLVIQSQPGSHRALLHAIFQHGGVAAERIALVAKAPRRDYFHRFLNLDLGLDPFPYNGHTSTLDALWMGVPVVTLAGRTAVGRGGVSTLSNLGLTELIAHTPAQYVDIAVAWARDLPRLAALRKELRERMRVSPLTDARQFAADVEAAFRQMWLHAGLSGSCFPPALRSRL
jgi:predicted O-linked N-acetylglucosamine transferase (SPINDLY family)